MAPSESLKQVWQWKATVHEKTKDMDTAERLAYFQDAERRVEEETGVSLNLPRKQRSRQHRPRRTEPKE